MSGQQAWFMPEMNKMQAEIDRLRAALSEIADGDAHYDGAAKFMEIAREALEK